VKRRSISHIVAAFALLISPLVESAPASAAATPSIYESLTGTDGGNINSTGSANSIGFTGNWSMVNANKNPGPLTGLAAVYRSSFNANLKFPTNSTFTLPSSNTAGSTAADLWNLYYSARQMTSAVNFDANGTFYLSFLGYSSVSAGSWGSYMVGLLNGLPTSTTDTSKNAIYLGRTYSGAPTIQLTSANNAAWNPSSYTATGTVNNPAAPDGNAWFIIAKITTAASGNDTIQLKFFASTSTLPTTDSGISWDVSYSIPITGSYGYLGVQTEYNGTIDEIRGGSSYDMVSGLPTAPTIGSPTISGTPNKGVSGAIVLNVGAAGFVRFYVDGKRIAGCLKVATAGTSPNFTATCNWKAPAKGLHQITADFTSTDPTYTNTKSLTSSVQVVKRTNLR
jgi:hypothetical protein